MTGTQASQGSATPVFRPTFCAEGSRRLVLISAILASALGFIDGSIVSIALPAMRESLGASLEQAQWINNAYMLPLSALILVGGAMGDRFGQARVFAAGIVLFIFASVATALATSPEVLIAARAVKGIGAAAMIPGSLALIARAYPREERGRAIGIWSGASALTTALGPVLGGAALTLFGPDVWRWLFAMNLPLGVIAIWLTLRAVNEDHGNPEKQIDWIGAILIATSFGLAAWILTGINRDGLNPVVIAGIAGFLLLAFIAWEARTPHPMMPLALFASPTFSEANIATFFLYFGLSAILFFLPMTVIAGWGVSEAATSVAFLPLTVFIALFSSKAGELASRIGPGRFIGAGSLIVALAFAGLGATVHLQSFWFAVMPCMILMGAGMSLVVAPLSTTVMAAVSDDSVGTASGINNAVSRAAGLVAVAAMGAVAAWGYASAGGPDSFGQTSDAVAHAAAINEGFRRVAWITAALSVCAALIAFFAIGKPDQTGS